MNYTRTSIANLALSFLGDRRINGITENSELAAICLELYGHAKQFSFEACPWRWAKKPAELQRDSTVPIARYGYAYSTPSDFVRIINIADNIDMSPLLDNWDVSGGKIITNAEYVFIEYVSNSFSEAIWPAYFVDVVAHKLAGDAAPRVSHAKADRDTIYERMNSKAIPMARVIDAQGGPQRRRVIRSNWSTQRFGQRARTTDIV